MLGICHLVIRRFIVAKNRSQWVITHLPVVKTNFIYVYIYIHIYINFVCQVLMSKYIYKKLRHLFTKKLYFGLFQTFKDSIYIHMYNFDVTMGSYDGAEICELSGIKFNL